jgi:hypothetical protein
MCIFSFLFKPTQAASQEPVVMFLSTSLISKVFFSVHIRISGSNTQSSIFFRKLFIPWQNWLQEYMALNFKLLWSSKSISTRASHRPFGGRRRQIWAPAVSLKKILAPVGGRYLPGAPGPNPISREAIGGAGGRGKASGPALSATR